MDIKAFKKACFDLAREATDIRATDPDIANMLVKEDEDGLWIRFTAIGSLLDYCQSNESDSVFSYCIRGAVLAALMHDALKGAH